jgi:hypothetical protein
VAQVKEDRVTVVGIILPGQLETVAEQESA